MFSEEDRKRAVIHNTPTEVLLRLNGTIARYKNAELIDTFSELDAAIERIREAKRAILYLKNTESVSS